MRTINRTLRESDDALLPILAKVWGVNIDALMDSGEIIDLLGKAMLDPARAEHVWATLDDKQRGALQTLIGSGTKMLTPRFERLFGEIRRMGAAKVERERPDENPASPAEALFYRGLIALGFEKDEKKGSSSIVYVPEDLLKILPVHKTAYEHLEDDESGEYHVETQVEAVKQVSDVRAADTSAVDDVTTLLAYLQLYAPLLDIDPVLQKLSDYRLAREDRAALLPCLLTPDEARLNFLLGVALSANLVDVQGGRAQPNRAEARRWLGAVRAEQVRRLAEAWLDSQSYRDLWHVPGLQPEPGGTLDSYDPAVVRHEVMDLMADLVPRGEWWSIEAFVQAVKEADPDFQRPGGDYESWYIRNEDGDYLQGFESWDAVEGALLEYCLLGPMHWLGLMDVGEDAARLTAYGRAFLNMSEWPNPPETPEKITVQDDGVLLVPRKVSRIDRFQVARFTTWGKPGDPYLYALDAGGIRQAAQQGITTAHISAFLTRMAGDAPLPSSVVRFLESWKSGPAATVTIERLLVLRTTDVETMDQIWNAPPLRRFLGARLGDMAVVVRADAWEALRDALGRQGIAVEVGE